MRQRISFLDIPTEIRLRIYGLLLKSPVPFELWDRTEVASRYYSPAWKDIREYASALPILLRLNKLISTEAAQVFYSANEFRISRHDAWIFLNSFLSTIGANIRFLRNLTVHVPFMQFRRPADFDVNVTCRIIEMRRLRVDLGDCDRVPHWMQEGKPDIEIINAAAFYQVYQRLGSLNTLRKLQLVLPTSYQVSGPYDVTSRRITCEETCDCEQESHVKRWHQDRFFWTHFDELKSRIPGLDIKMVMLHDTSGTRWLRSEWSYPSRVDNPHLWVLQRAKRRDYGIGFAVWGYQPNSCDYCKYDVTFKDNIVQPHFPDWQFPA